MEPIPQLGTVIAVVVGTVFSALGVLGYIRMPDVYTRLHATGKVGVFGVVILLVAAVLWTPLGFGKALVLILFLLIAGPATSHAMASAAYRIGIPLAQATRDDLGAVSEVAASQNMRLRREDAPSS
jgi:multicomponent Na+:H+ antiporter subunit G